MLTVLSLYWSHDTQQRLVRLCQDTHFQEMTRLDKSTLTATFHAHDAAEVFGQAQGCMSPLADLPGSDFSCLQTFHDQQQLFGMTLGLSECIASAHCVRVLNAKPL